MASPSYAGPASDVPLAGYAAALALFTGIFGGLLVRAQRRRSLPARVAFSDVALIGIATHALARIATRDAVTSPLRAPFTRFRERAGAGEVREEPRGGGLRRAVGQLVTCPYCASPWIAAALTAAMAWRARPTRIATAAFASAAIADALHQVYAFARGQS